MLGLWLCYTLAAIERMKYYRIRQTGEQEVTGIKDGTAQAEHDENIYTNQEEWKKYYSFLINNWFSRGKQDWFSEKRFPPDTFNLEVKMRKGAFFTDFLSYASSLGRDGDFLVSERLVKILKSVSVPEYQLHNVFVHNHPDKNYKLFYCPALPLDFLDLRNSRFVNDHDIHRKHHIITTPSEYIKLIQKKPFLRCEKISLNKRFGTDLDLFKVSISPSWFISERLKEIFEMFEITGVVIQEPVDEQIIITSC